MVRPQMLNPVKHLARHRFGKSDVDRWFNTLRHLALAENLEVISPHFESTVQAWHASMEDVKDGKEEL